MANRDLKEKLRETRSSEEDSLFCNHPSEDRIVLLHALFWVMSQSLKGKNQAGEVFASASTI